VTPVAWELSVVGVLNSMAMLLGATAVKGTNSEWRTHDATSATLEPEPKGEGTVWQRDLIRPNRINQNLNDCERGNAS
jgi:hypothetical protein